MLAGRPTSILMVASTACSQHRSCAVVLLVLLVSLASPAHAQQPDESTCSITELNNHLNDISEVCCPGNDCSVTGYPGADATCSTECALQLEPFWDSCSDLLGLLDMIPDGLSDYYATCMAVLYPPGACGDTCDTATFHCRTMEIDQACCTMEDNCPESSAIPNVCSVGCALLYPSYIEDCADILRETEDESTMSMLQEFVETCETEQDPSALLEYADALQAQGCWS